MSADTRFGGGFKVFIAGEEQEEREDVEGPLKRVPEERTA
jgi:hypothetical protein